MAGHGPLRTVTIVRSDARPVPVVRRRVLAVAAGAAIGAAAYAGIASAGFVGHADAHVPSPPALVERAACTAPTPPPGQASGAVVAQRVTVTVRPTALLQVDARGRVTAAWTNTGCAPRRSDDLFVQRPDGTIRAGDPDLARRRWTGDFREAGVLVAQPAARRP